MTDTYLCTNSDVRKIQIVSELLDLICCVHREMSVLKIGRNVLRRSFASLTVYSSETLFLVKVHAHNATTHLTELRTVAATTAPSLIKERNLKTKYSTPWNYGTLALQTSYPFCTSSSSLFVLLPPSSFMKWGKHEKGSIAENYNISSQTSKFSHLSAVAYRGGFGGFNPPPEIPKTLQNRAKLNPIVKTVKNCRI